MVSYDHWYTALGRESGVYHRLLEQVFGPAQYVGQQGFATRDQILELARAVGAASGTRILDVCSGTAGPAACIADATGCRMVSLDCSLPALRLAKNTIGSHARLVAADAHHLPFRDQRFDAALVLDSFASLPEPGVVVAELARVVRPGGRLGFTAEVGRPLGAAEEIGFARTTAPRIQTLPDWLALLQGAGFVPLSVRDCTPGAAMRADRLARSLAREQTMLARDLGQPAVSDLALTLATWAGLLGDGRVAEIAAVAQRLPALHEPCFDATHARIQPPSMLTSKMERLSVR